ncbi:MAG: hypothetical protein COB33_009880 [Thiotrichaceae bacterium]|nr:hypothetical protein [Thiotrichaceae bacterium]PCI12200.1 MAG: hypothetical protein COB71_10095 [Thiotrichales bacterium]
MHTRKNTSTINQDDSYITHAPSVVSSSKRLFDDAKWQLVGVGGEQNDDVALYILPAVKWARRVSGVFGNQLAGGSSSRAHAILTPYVSGFGYQVSVRASLNKKERADIL